MSERELWFFAQCEDCSWKRSFRIQQCNYLKCIQAEINLPRLKKNIYKSLAQFKDFRKLLTKEEEIYGIHHSFPPFLLGWQGKKINLPEIGELPLKLRNRELVIKFIAFRSVQ